MNPSSLRFWLRDWRPDRRNALAIVAIILIAALTWIFQARFAAQLRQVRSEAISERAELNQRLDAVQRVLDRLSKTVASDEDPKLAVDLGQRAIKEGRWGTGQLFLINAITNDPKNVNHLKTYTNAVLAHERPPEEALDQLASILQMAACHVAPDDVSTVVELIDRVGKVKNPSPAASGTTQVDPASDSPASDGLDAEWARLKDQGGDARIYQDPLRLTERLRALENFATTLDEQGNATEERTREVADQILRWTEIAQATKNANYVDQCLNKLSDQELGPMTTDRAVSIIQAAEATLPSFWGIRAETLPDELLRKINAYPSIIKDRVDKISSKKSVDLFKQIDDKLKVADTLGPQPTLQKRSEALEKQIKEAQVLAAQLPSPNDILLAQGKIEDRTKILQKCRSEQYSKYQSEVIRRSQEAFKIYNSYTLGISEANSVVAIHNERLPQVDQSLLTPEVSRIFNDVLGKLMGKLGPDNLVKIESEMGSGQKLKLEDF